MEKTGAKWWTRFMQFEVVKADITKLSVEAIVNAANSRLAGGGGVDGAIHRAAGTGLVEACREIGRCATGDAVATPAFLIRNVKWIIHAVGPVYGTPRAAELLASAYAAALREGEKLGARSIAFPCISTGVYGYPKPQAARIAIATVRAHAATLLERVVFCCFDIEDLEIYRRELSLSAQPSGAK